uniref:Uncharacterized protein n=1 Tax=Aplanochytrium stocchinoi TaxID=215587 RepID=A0A7S3V2I4_9STRA|mmetsp:Transcript_5465/g.6915  ORF Transcript_5465/g.6915 Transcript_5465/m.6915 type:complete len:283 (+) Transcript_5465:87-935(+)
MALSTLRCKHSDLSLLRNVLYETNHGGSDGETELKETSPSFVSNCTLLFSRKNKVLWKYLDEMFRPVSDNSDQLFHDTVKESLDYDINDHLLLTAQDIRNYQSAKFELEFWKSLGEDFETGASLNCSALDELRCGQGYAFSSKSPNEACLSGGDGKSHVFAIVKHGEFLYWIQGSNSGSQAFEAHTPKQFLDIVPNLRPKSELEDLETEIDQLWRRNGNILHCPRGRTKLLKKAIEDNNASEMYLLLGNQVPNSMSKDPIPFFVCDCRCPVCCNCGCNVHLM